MDPLQRYSSSLKRAKSFFEGKNTKTPKGTPITQSQLLKLYQNRADCPICGTEFSGTNHNTEHIHPRALGGANVASNKIQMCKLCNNCRNMTMQHGLIGPPYSKSYPQMWEQIQRFIMWAEITIDDGLQAGEMFPEIHQFFMDERFAGQSPPKHPTRAFGRASTLDAATVPNYAHNGSPRATTPVTPTALSAPATTPASEKKGFWQRVATPLLDFLTGYGREQPVPDRQTRGKKKPLRSTPNVSEAALEDGPPKVELEPRSTDDFVEFMLSILTPEPRELSLVGRSIESHLAGLNAKFTTTTYFLSLHGYPRGLKKAIETHLGHRVVVTENAGKQYVALTSGDLVVEIPPVVKPTSSLIYETKPPTKKCPAVDSMFQRHVLAALSGIENEIKLSTISSVLEEYLESIGEPGKSFKQFAKSYGIPTTRTAVEIIDHYFPNTIGYRREGKTVVHIWLRISEEE